MKNKESTNNALDYFQNLKGESFKFDEEAIFLAYKQDNVNQSLSIKILSVLGGILASLAFVGFLYIAGLYKSEIGLLVIGGIFIVSSIWISKKYDKIIIDTISVSCFIIGFILIGISCYQLKVHENIISIIFILIAFSSLVIVRNYMLSFVSVLIIHGSILSLIVLNKDYHFIHLYVSFLAVTMAYIFLKEASIIKMSKALSKLYNPIKIGLIFSFISGLFFLGKKGILPINYIWTSSIIIISIVIYLISTLFNALNTTKKSHKISIYILTTFVLLPTALSPAISGAILVILLSFLVNYKTGFVIGIISFMYFISQYYYDLNFTLLTKSIILFSTGILFIVLYLFTHKQLTEDEKV